MSALEEISHLADVPVYLDIELDRKILTARDILKLEVRSVIKLPRSAGENIDILVGGVLIGSGEIVVIGETVGVRISDFVEEN
jgi:flagellar motor switch protein FliN/FliY